MLTEPQNKNQIQFNKERNNLATDSTMKNDVVNAGKNEERRRKLVSLSRKEEGFYMICGISVLLYYIT